MDDKSFQICLGLRLRLDVSTTHRFVCAGWADEKGYHALNCDKAIGRHSPHANLNLISKKALERIGVFSELEPLGLSLSDGRRPDDMNLSTLDRRKKPLYRTLHVYAQLQLEILWILQPKPELQHAMPNTENRKNTGIRGKTSTSCRLDLRRLVRGEKVLLRYSRDWEKADIDDWRETIDGVSLPAGILSYTAGKCNVCCWCTVPNFREPVFF